LTKFCIGVSYTYLLNNLKFHTDGCEKSDM
jgi:hypothetical protein